MKLMLILAGSFAVTSGAEQMSRIVQLP